MRPLANVRLRAGGDFADKAAVVAGGRQHPPSPDGMPYGPPSRSLIIRGLSGNVHTNVTNLL